MRHFKLLVAILMVLTVLSACVTKPTATPTSVPEPITPTFPIQPATPTSPVEATPTSMSGSTVRELAVVGQPFYVASCARCHGATAQGASAPALIGANAKVDKFGNAQALLQYMSRSMPPNAPGSLTAEQYVQVLAWLLLGNGYVQPDTVLDVGNLANLLLRK